MSELKRIVVSTLAVTICVILAVTTLVVAIDIHCSNDSYYWMPVYPGAVLLETPAQGYIRLRGMGETVQIYSSPDTPTEIRAWHREYRREVTEGRQNDNPDAPIQDFSTNNYTVEFNEDGTASIITYYTQCAE